MEITFLGGGNEIGASSALVEIGAHRILVDCGVRMSGDNVLPDFGLLAARGLPAVDAVVQTHAHFDHSGALPVFHQQYPATPVYMTPPTQALISILLQDSLRIAKSQFEAEGDLPPFPPAAVDSLMTRIIPVPFDTPTTLGSTSLVATWFPAGHILGAAAVGIEGNDHGKTVRVLFSGDLAVGNQLTVPGMPVPSAFRRPDVLVIESTYGNRLHSPRQAEEQRLLQWLASILDRQGKVLIPAFAIGRAQELALLCIRAMRQRHMPPFPVYLDGMVRSVCRTYTDFPTYQTAFCQRLTRDYGNPFLGAVDEVRMVAAPQEREKVLSGPPCVIIASSGMLSGGASADYAPVIAQSARNAIAITGYQDEESPGRRLLDLAAGKGDSLLIGGRSVAVQCDVTAYSLSAHADADELTRLIDSINPREVVLVHGDGAARTALADRLYRSTNQHRKVHLPRTGDTLQFGRRAPVHSPASPPAQVGIGQGDALDAATLPRLVEHLLTRPSAPPWSPAALLDLWYGTGSWDDTHFAALVALLDSKPPGLRRHPKRPQLYQVIDPAAPPPAPAAKPAPPRWTEQEIGARVAEALGADPDLYHVGFHLGMRQVRLRFAFPEVAAVRYREQFARVLEGTGWTVHLNKLPHQERLAEAACALVPDGYTAAQTARAAPGAQDRRPDARSTAPRRARVHPGGGPAGAHRLHARVCGHRVAAPGWRSAGDSPCRGHPTHGNERRLPGHRHRVCRGCRPRRGPTGRASKRGRRARWIELAFLTPEVAQQHEALLHQLSARTGYALTIKDEANQSGLVAYLQAVIPDAWQMQSTPSILRAKKLVRVTCASPPRPGSGAYLLIADRVRQETGWTLAVETRRRKT